MKTELRNVYSCDHCRKKYVQKSHAEKHEKKCFKNPANFRACHNCKHLEMTEHTLYGDHQNGYEWKSEVKVLKCNKLGKLVYPPIVDNKGNDPYEFGDIANDPMPVNCDSREDAFGNEIIDAFDFLASTAYQISRQ